MNWEDEWNWISGVGHGICPGFLLGSSLGQKVFGQNFVFLSTFQTRFDVWKIKFLGREFEEDSW